MIKCYVDSRKLSTSLFFDPSATIIFTKLTYLYQVINFACHNELSRKYDVNSSRNEKKPPFILTHFMMLKNKVHLCKINYRIECLRLIPVAFISSKRFNFLAFH